jgi:predicted nucleic acid-binding Zn ribbon protein
MKSGKSSPTPIADVLKTVFDKLDPQSAVSRESVDSFWKELVGEVGFRHSRPSALRKGLLTVRVDSSAWLEELAMKKRKLLKGLQSRLGKDKISQIHFKTGEF